LKQELLQCIDDKFDSSVSDDLLWQNMSVTGSPVRPSTVRKGALVFTDSDDDIDESSEISNSSLKTYWGIVRDRLKSEACDAMSLATSHVDSLPHHWTVVSISVTQDRSTLIVSRRRPSHKPLIVYLPLSRQDRRDDSDQDKFTWEMAKEELSSIIAASDETSKNARAAIETEHRRAWWAERSMLDERLKTFLENVEYCWLGVFKVRSLREMRCVISDELRSP
jgi:separase